MNKKEVLRWEIIGFVIIFFLGSFMHFAFALSGEFLPLALLAAVNESVWEHLKLAFWPALFFALFEFCCLKYGKKTNNFWSAKAVGIAAMPVLIIVFFYLYRMFLADSLFMDIFIFGLAVFLGQMISYKIMVYQKFNKINEKLGLIALVLMIIIFSLFTYFPPHLELFRDAVTGGFGII